MKLIADQVKYSCSERTEKVNICCVKWLLLKVNL